MAGPARDALEALLRARKLDGTLATHAEAGSRGWLPTGEPALDERLGGGLPRGQLSEIVGPASSGRTTLAARILAAATANGEIAALVDTADRFDPASGAALGIDLSRLLWIRGEPADAAPRGLDRALKAMHLVLQAGKFGVVAWDLTDLPPAVVKRPPFTIWLRLQRALEGTTTVGLLVGAAPLARSAGGATLVLHPRRRGGRWSTGPDHVRTFQGLTTGVDVVEGRWRQAAGGPVDLEFEAGRSPR